MDLDIRLLLPAGELPFVVGVMYLDQMVRLSDWVAPNGCNCQVVPGWRM